MLLERWLLVRLLWRCLASGLEESSCGGGTSLLVLCQAFIAG